MCTALGMTRATEVEEERREGHRRETKTLLRVT